MVVPMPRLSVPILYLTGDRRWSVFCADELLAFRKFFELRAPDVKVELLSLDLQPTWRPYVEAMGMGFDQWYST